MTHHHQLLGAWQSRSEPSGNEQFSTQARQRIASLFLEAAIADGAVSINGSQQSGLDVWSTELADLAIADGLSAPIFRIELRNCQLSVVDILLSAAIDADTQDSAAAQSGALQSVATMLASLDRLVTRSSIKLAEIDALPHDAVTSPDTNGKKKKTLQHEIRTPLQGALLTTELMLEDAGQGDPVSADDILAVRKSIETAVGILNDFASGTNCD